MKNTMFISPLAMLVLFSSQTMSDTPLQWQGTTYSQNSEPQKMWFEIFSSNLGIKGNEDILDIGCGDGKLTFEIAKKLNTGTITGIDTSKSMIEFAKKNNKQKNLSFFIGDAQNFKLNKKFDLIVSFATLHWVKDYDQVVRYAKEHLKPGGRIYFVFSTKMRYFPINESFSALYNSQKWMPYFKNYHPGYYSHEIDPWMDALIRHGLSVKEISLKNKLTIFKTEPELFSWLKAWIPQQYQAPKGRGDEFIHDFIKEYIKHGTKDDLGIHWKGFLLKIEASLEAPMPQNSPDLLINNTKN